MLLIKSKANTKIDETDETINNTFVDWKYSAVLRLGKIIDNRLISGFTISEIVSANIKSKLLILLATISINIDKEL